MNKALGKWPTHHYVVKTLPRASRSKAADLYKAMADIAKRRYVPKEVKEERRAICAACPHWQKRLNRCSKCGCQMGVKTSLASSECPIGKWGPHLAILE